jgi:hypothetical protein
LFSPVAAMDQNAKTALERLGIGLSQIFILKQNYIAPYFFFLVFQIANPNHLYQN